MTHATVMHRAWAVSRLAASLYGGRPVEYFSTALRRAWGCERDSIAWWNS